MPELVPATAQMVKSFLGHSVPLSLYVRAILDEGKICGIGGYYYRNGRAMLFTQLTEEARKRLPRYAKPLITITRSAMRSASEHCLAVRAYADPNIPNSVKALEHFGFQPIGSGYYEWKP